MNPAGPVAVIVAIGTVYAIVGLALSSTPMLATGGLVVVIGLAAGFIGGRRYQRRQR